MLIISRMELVEEIHRAETLLDEFIPHYWDRESETPDSLKIVMLFNDWHSPVIACEELLKRIDGDEGILRRNKIKFKDVNYSSRYIEYSDKLNEVKNNKRYFIDNCVTENGITYQWGKGFLIVSKDGKELLKCLDVFKDNVPSFEEVKRLTRVCFFDVLQG